MKRKLVFILSLAVMLIGVLSLKPKPVMADGYVGWGGNCGESGFLGLKPWYDGLCNSQGEIVTPKGKQEVQTFVWTII